MMSCHYFLQTLTRPDLFFFIVKLSVSLSFDLLTFSLRLPVLELETSLGNDSELLFTLGSVIPVCLEGNSRGRGFRFTWIMLTGGSLTLVDFDASEVILLSSFLVASVLAGVTEDWDVSVELGPIRLLLLSLLCFPKQSNNTIQICSW